MRSLFYLISIMLVRKEQAQKIFTLINNFCHEAVGLEGNVIFSQYSYLPRSASLNLTVDIFGQSVNLLEVECILFSGSEKQFLNFIYSLG